MILRNGFGEAGVELGLLRLDPACLPAQLVHVDQRQAHARRKFHELWANHGSKVGEQALKFFGLADGTAFNGTFRGAFKGLKGAITPVVVTLRGSLKEVDMGDWKAGDKAEIKHTVGVTYYKLEVDGRLIYEIDPVGMKRVIDGVDQLAAQRSALGL